MDNRNQSLKWDFWFGLIILSMFSWIILVPAIVDYVIDKINGKS